ncbi:MAG: TatD family hydrolase [Edaphobacter sp.]|uniref:TatD family hydrolase n=1 Tax=Edaphobacter sp. TaxID=1934404 RepID=UPI0023945303|nr:TatD family hydrolase [Edaphobacter sp.]MDE1177570.1 TatD family hydrolase [Edaphobacter sp.]
MLIDSHAHLDFYTTHPAERDEILASAWDAGVRTILAIGIGEGPSEMHKALDLATSVAADTQPRNTPVVWATAGIHPEQAHNATPEALAELTRLASHDRCIAVGEIGLDYYHLENPDIPTQKAAFIAQMEIAIAVKKPIAIHCRTSELATPKAKERYGPADAAADTYSLIAEHFRPSGLPGIMHCFSGNVDDARHALDLGFYLSFAGNLTYPRAQNIRDAALFAPADRILVETDAPFLAPVPLRGQRNQPAYVAHTAAALAQLRGIPAEQLASITTENFYRLFPVTRPVVEA